MATNMGSMRILIKGGKVVNDDFTQEADVYIENGIIQQVDYIYMHKLHKCILTMYFHGFMVQVPRTVKRKHCFVSDIFPSLTHTYYAAVTVANFTVIQYEKTAAHSKLYSCT